MRAPKGLTKLTGLCVVGGVLLAGLLFPIAGGLGLMSNQASAAIDSVSADMVKEEPPLVTTITDRNGAPLATLYEQYRIPTPQKDIAKSMQAAIVAIEDRRFYQHGAIDPKGALRAAVNDVGGGNTQGASTITQQYVKNYLVNVVDRHNPVEKQKDQEESLARKLREARIAIQIEGSMSKDQILTGYLNVVSFSHNTFGVGAASKVFFGTTADKLTIPQAALLAGNVNNPILYDPWKHPKQALSRRNTVIDAMVANQSITKAQATEAKKAPLGVLQPAPSLPPSNCYATADDVGFFCDYVKQYLEEAGITEDQIDSGGYTIKTTLDPKISRITKDAVNGNVSPTADGVANAFAVIQPGSKSHDVLAMVANRNFGTDPSQGQTSYNLVSGVSNPFGGGSSFKIFTSATALEQGGAGLNTQLPNPPSQCIQPPITNSSTPCNTFHNLGSYADPISLRNALATSPNVAFVNLEKQVGLPNVLDMAYRLGLRHTMVANEHGRAPDPSSKDPYVDQPQIQAYHNDLSFTLGFSQVSPLEMANVAATLKSAGVWCPPNPIESITDRNGNPVHVNALPCQQVLSPQVANALQDGMSQDTVSGTSAEAAKAAGWSRPDIGKTGTTQQNKSVAFVGGVNNYAVSSMVFADNSTPRPICPGHPIIGSSWNCGNAFGGSVAAPPYFQAFNKILAGQPSQPVPSADPAFLDANGHGPNVPFVMLQKTADAQNALKKAGYPSTVQTVPGSIDSKGTIIGETPMGDVKKGTKITLYASDGSINPNN